MNYKRYIIKILTGLGLALILSSQTAAQEYNDAIGLRFGSSVAITAKHFLNEKAAFEGIISTRHRGWIITGLYERHVQAFNVSGLNWFYGAGGHAGAYLGCYHRSFGSEHKESHYEPTVGIDAIIGMEYFIKDIPFAISADIKPALDLRCPGWGLMDAAVSVRYVF